MKAHTRASHIRTPNPYMARTLFPLLTSAPQKRLVVVGEGTHTLMLHFGAFASAQARFAGCLPA